MAGVPRHCFHCVMETPLTRQSSNRHGSSTHAVARVISYVEENLGEDLALETLASVACRSRFHFTRMFRGSVGSSPMAYVSQRRIERAKQLLPSCESSIAAIAADLGFCDQSHFIRRFREATGVTPARFRRGSGPA
jgi:AraC family transcriptional regulator